MLTSSTKGRFFLLIGGLWLLSTIGVVCALFWPQIGRKYEVQKGEYCNENLERLFEAKQALARELNWDPSRPQPPVIQQLELKDIAPYLRRDRLDLSCPSGGHYQIRPLLDADGEVVPPICDHAKSDPDANGIDEDSEGLHIHLRSHLQNSDTGLYYRDPGLAFPGDPQTTPR
ncbi:MAG: hypothetical protein H3C63_15800 [Candidatus Omnitrophica bacterium]|nr:hypothetical protein [Candidatus Omnitrophota bacterium]